MIKNRCGPLWGQARGDPPVMLMARVDPDPGGDQRSRAPAGCANCLVFNRLILPKWGRYGLKRMVND